MCRLLENCRHRAGSRPGCGRSHRANHPASGACSSPRRSTAPDCRRPAGSQPRLRPSECKQLARGFADRQNPARAKCPAQQQPGRSPGSQRVSVSCQFSLAAASSGSQAQSPLLSSVAQRTAIFLSVQSPVQGPKELARFVDARSGWLPSERKCFPRPGATFISWERAWNIGRWTNSGSAAKPVRKYSQGLSIRRPSLNLRDAPGHPPPPFTTAWSRSRDQPYCPRLMNL